MMNEEGKEEDKDEDLLLLASGGCFLSDVMMMLFGQFIRSSLPQIWSIPFDILIKNSAPKRSKITF